MSASMIRSCQGCGRSPSVEIEGAIEFRGKGDFNDEGKIIPIKFYCGHGGSFCNSCKISKYKKNDECGVEGCTTKVNQAAFKVLDPIDKKLQVEANDKFSNWIRRFNEVKNSGFSTKLKKDIVTESIHWLISQRKNHANNPDFIRQLLEKIELPEGMKSEIFNALLCELILGFSAELVLMRSVLNRFDQNISLETIEKLKKWAVDPDNRAMALNIKLSVGRLLNEAIVAKNRLQAPAPAGGSSAAAPAVASSGASSSAPDSSIHKSSSSAIESIKIREYKEKNPNEFKSFVLKRLEMLNNSLKKNYSRMPTDDQFQLACAVNRFLDQDHDLLTHDTFQAILGGDQGKRLGILLVSAAIASVNFGFIDALVRGLIKVNRDYRKLTISLIENSANSGILLHQNILNLLNELKHFHEQKEHGLGDNEMASSSVSSDVSSASSAYSSNK